MHHLWLDKATLCPQQPLCCLSYGHLQQVWLCPCFAEVCNKPGLEFLDMLSDRGFTVAQLKKMLQGADMSKAIELIGQHVQQGNWQGQKVLLFISYKFVKGFLAITFLSPVIYSWNFHDVCDRFLYSQKPNFSWIRLNMRNLPTYPYYKIAHFFNVMSLDVMLQKWAIFIIGSVGKFFVFCRIKLKFHFWLYKKRWHTSWKFQFEKTSNTKVFDKLIWNEQ